MRQFPSRTIFNGGTSNAISVKTILPQSSTFRATLSFMKTSMTTGPGATIQPTATFGFRMASLSAGLPITTDTGPSSRHGAGLGQKMNRGDLRPSITDVGQLSGAVGAGAAAP